MSVAAELADDARRRQHGQVGGHHRHRAAEVTEGRRGHQQVLELDERGDAAAHRASNKLEGGGLPRLGFQFAVLLAAHLLAPRLT